MTEEREQQILSRLKRLEEAVNDIFVAQARMISRDQMNQLNTLIQAEQQTLREDLDALTDRVTIIENEPLS